MAGFEATSLIRRHGASTGPHIPIVAVTAHAMKGDREKCLSAGMDAYISKPVSAKELAEVLESVAPTSAAVTQPAGCEALDLVIKREAILRRIGGDADLLRELAEAFILSASELVTEMRAAAATDDLPSVARAAHAYKGSASVFGLTPVVDLAAKLEALARQEPGQTAGLVSKLESETTKAYDLLNALLEEVPCAS